jgi:hypothetical protein
MEHQAGTVGAAIMVEIQGQSPSFRTDKVITFEGDTLVWVDLWRGALLCNMLDENPVAQYIRMPRATIGNKGNCCIGKNGNSGSEKTCQLFPDVTYTKNMFKIKHYERPNICKGLIRSDIVMFSDDDELDDILGTHLVWLEGCHVEQDSLFKQPV